MDDDRICRHLMATKYEYSVGVRHVETHEWSDEAVTATSHEEAAEKAKEQSRRFHGPFERHDPLETDVERLDEVST